MSKISKVLIFSFLLIQSLALQAEIIMDHKGNAIDMSKPVKVFILMGQSNMVGFGKISGGKDGCLDYAVKNEGLYPFFRTAKVIGLPARTSAMYSPWVVVVPVAKAASEKMNS